VLPFPVCIYINEALELSNVIKIDLGYNINGNMAVTAHTLVVPESVDNSHKCVDPELANDTIVAYNAKLVAVLDICT